MSLPTSRPAPQAHPGSRDLAAPRLPTGDQPLLPAARSPVDERGEVLFEVPFVSALSDSDLELLARRLELYVHTQPLPGAENDAARRRDSPAFARLDHPSGLFLKRGAFDGGWLLEARTWGRPAARSVHEWHVLAASAARMLDPAVILPERLEPAAYEITLRPVGHAANKRLARFRRRLVGLP